MLSLLNGCIQRSVSAMTEASVPIETAPNEVVETGSDAARGEGLTRSSFTTVSSAWPHAQSISIRHSKCGTSLFMKMILSICFDTAMELVAKQAMSSRPIIHLEACFMQWCKSDSSIHERVKIRRTPRRLT